MWSSISATLRGGLTAANLEAGMKGRSEREYEWAASKTEQTAEEGVLWKLLFLVFLPHLSHFLVLSPPHTVASHSITLKPFLLRAYQHICLERLVFPSIFTPCFPKASLDPRNSSASSVSLQASWSKKPGCETKDPLTDHRLTLTCRNSLNCMGTNEEGTWCDGFHCSTPALHEQVDL